MSEEKKFDVRIEGSELVVMLDTNLDGQPLVDLKVNLSEGFQEAFARGEEILGAKVVAFKFVGTKLILELDTDKDGEKLLKLELDLGEAFDEVSTLVAK